MTDHTAPIEFDPRLLSDPDFVRSLLLAYVEMEVKNKPKATALDRLAATDGDLCITDAAKTLAVHPRDLTEHLRVYRWIYRRRRSTNWIAYQGRIKSGHLRHRVTTITREDGTPKTVSQVLVTMKGLAALALAFSRNTKPKD